jgi:hypothetical protein
MTLIELLIATAIAVVVIGTVLAVFVSISGTTAMQGRWRDKTMPSAEALDAMIRDLTCMAAPADITNQPFSVTMPDDKKEPWHMSFYSCFPTGVSNAWRDYSISMVNYSLKASIAQDEFILTRESVPFRVPSRNPLASGKEKWPGIRRLEMVLYDGAAWTNRWGDGKSTNALPQSVQIRIVTVDGREFKSEVIIPAAKKITIPKKNERGLTK